MRIDTNNDPVLIDIVTQRATKTFEEKYANLLSCFRVTDLFLALAASFRLDGGPSGADFTVPAIVAATEEHFKNLLMRGALREFQVIPPPIPEAAQRELDLLFGVDESEIRESQNAQVSARQALIEEAKRDWRTLDGRECKRKWANTPDRFAILEAAWAELEAEDKAVADGYRAQREQREREANQAISRPLSTRDF